MSHVTHTLSWKYKYIHTDLMTHLTHDSFNMTHGSHNMSHDMFSSRYTHTCILTTWRTWPMTHSTWLIAHTTWNMTSFCQDTRTCILTSWRTWHDAHDPWLIQHDSWLTQHDAWHAFVKIHIHPYWTRESMTHTTWLTRHDSSMSQVTWHDPSICRTWHITCEHSSSKYKKCWVTIGKRSVDKKIENRK